MAMVYLMRATVRPVHADTFNRANNSSDPNLASDGGTWINDVVSWPSSVWGISGNRLVQNGSSSGSILYTDLGTAVCDIQATNYNNVRGFNPGLVAAHTPGSSGGTCYVFGGNNWTQGTLVRRSGGSTSTLATFTIPNANPSLPAYSSVLWRLTYDGAGHLVGYMNGSAVVTVTDASPLTGTKVGIYEESTVAGGSASSWDDWTAA